MSRGSKEALRSRLLAIFREEAADHMAGIVSEMERLAADLSEQELQDGLGRLFRIVHTFKGAARSLSMRPLERACHGIEDLCADLSQQRRVFDGDALAQLRGLQAQLAEATALALAGPEASPDAAPAAPPAPPPRSDPPEPARPPPAAGEAPEGGSPASRARMPLMDPSAPSAFVRIGADQVQRLGLLAEDLLLPRLSALARAEEAQQLLAQVALLRREHKRGNQAGRASRDVADPAAGSGLAEDLRALEQNAKRLAQGLAADHRTLRTMLDALMGELRRARMMPAGEMLAVFPAMVGDLAQEAGKPVQWRTWGADLLIDRQLAELIKDPLIQMVRNAIDHGLETATERMAAGKPRQGTLSVTFAPTEGGRVAIEVADDGGGIDLDAVREAAVRGRVLSRAEAETLAPAQALDLVFQSNLSTRSVISALSGRGLGLAIVRERVERLGGSVRLASERGRGTAIRMEVPAAIANFRGIGVRTGGVPVIWPKDAVERTLSLPGDAYEAACRRGALQLGTDLLPFGHLGLVLGQEPGTLSCLAGTGLRSALVLRHGGLRGVSVVDEVTGDCEVVVKELRPPLLRVRHVLACGLQGNGQLAFILRPADVLEALAGARNGTAAEPVVPRAIQHRLLVVDDSLTTRAMEVGLLEAAGYEVRAAADGLEAWALLQRETFHAVVSDVDMPNMDGFELTEKIRADPHLRPLPVVLVTALENREDHDRGLKVGANAYMMKSAFDQSMLIDLVRRVL